ncbi:aminoimidazole riboside kinase [Vibrio sp. 10N.222.51.C12]|uniref:aminoimidazole riboside kinase n=1 Tax=unclassified Vibrio TaxID=2614977 RepID=UPI000C82B547|nr:aminoimidazole riboside kinase [Vibrio sp. 10N.286.48.B7]PMH79337.1 aminoimidazole riboside kinase [Vibrio sp. 10N.286.48.B7]
MNKIWVTGDAVVDLIPDGETRYLKCPGGAPANVAVAISRLGGDTAFFGKVGQDPLGRFMKQTLADEKVSTVDMHLDKHQRTSTVIIDLDDDGERSFTFMVKPSADQFFSVEDIPEFKAAQWMHSCSIALANEPSRSATMEAMKRIKAAGGYISFDPNLRDEVWLDSSEIQSVVMNAVKLADVVKFSEEELVFLTATDTLETALSILSEKRDRLFIVTLGASGALAMFNGERKSITGTKVEQVIDTTGAGDAFVGGLLAKLSQAEEWRSWPHIEAAVKWGNGCGALATTQKGAMTALPSLEQLIALIGD